MLEFHTAKPSAKVLNVVACSVALFMMLQPVRAQSDQQQGVSEAEQKKARDERDKKTLALLDEVLKEMESLKLPENRIHVAIGIAGQIWSRDPKRARALFKDAAASLNELARENDEDDPNDTNRAEASLELTRRLRGELAQIVASHEPQLAAEFLRMTRTDYLSNRALPGVTNYEANIEMRTANQIAAKDPELALSLAEESLKITVDYEAFNLLNNLQSQRKQLAERFLDDLMGTIRTYGIGNSATTPIALNLLRTWAENNRARDAHSPGTASHLALANLNDDTAREITAAVIKAVTNPSPTPDFTHGGMIIDGPSPLYNGQLHGIYQQLKPLLPDLEKLVPERAGVLRDRMEEYERSSEGRQAGAWNKFQELTQNGTVDSIMEAAKALPQYSDSLLQQAALKAINQGDEATARQIAEKIADPRERSSAKTIIARQGYYRAVEQKRFAQARGFLSSLPLEEQVSLLTQMASAAALDGDKATALALLGEAQSLIPNRATGYGTLQAWIMVAGAFEQLDASKSPSLVERVIDQTNDLVAAALVLNGFDVNDYFRNDEFVIANGNPLNMIAETCGRELGVIARTDIDRARVIAERFQRPEMRLIALLQVAQGLATN